MKFNKACFSLEWLEDNPYCHRLGSSSWRSQKRGRTYDNWFPSNWATGVMWVRKCRGFFSDNFINYFFCREGQWKSCYKRTWWDSVWTSVWCSDHLCFRIQTSSYSISEDSFLYKIRRCFYFSKIWCVGKVVLDLCKYIMVGTKTRNWTSGFISNRLKLDKGKKKTKPQIGRMLFQQFLCSKPLVLGR